MSKGITVMTMAGMSVCLVVAGCAPVLRSTSLSNAGDVRSGSAIRENSTNADGVSGGSSKESKAAIQRTDERAQTGVSAVDGTADAAAEACPPRPAYSNMRYEEDWRALADRRCAIDGIDRLKFVPLGRRASLSFGGEARMRYERFENAGFGRGVQDRDGYLLQRYLLHADVRTGERFRLFGQLESAWIDGRSGGPRPTDENKLDVNQLFGEWTMRRSADRVTVRVERQEVELGSAQFTSARDGLNDRLSFDGVRVLGDVGDWSFHAMATRVVPTVRYIIEAPTTQTVATGWVQ